ncbi:hypothetical protein CJJ09_003723 [Candidozyma auris]|nr:hypothetical protein CJJ09_003723 [[Candida] auris]
MVSIVSDPAQGNPIAMPRAASKEPREPDRRVAQRRQLHPVHNGQGASRHRAHADSDKSVNGVPLAAPQRSRKSGRGLPIQFLRISVRQPLTVKKPRAPKRTSGNNSVFENPYWKNAMIAVGTIAERK